MKNKKRQSEPVADLDNESTESCDDNQNMSAISPFQTQCTHIDRAVDLGKLKKVLKSGLMSECGKCVKMAGASVPDAAANDFEYDTTIWLCLRCGNEACGRFRQKHALQHFRTPHSDSHALCVNTTNWLIWCYECDNEIVPNYKYKLFEAYNYVKKRASPLMNMWPKDQEDWRPAVMVDVKKEIEQTNHDPLPNLPRLRGLVNLGNTCFFNAVLQCLAQTPFLVPVLKEMSVRGEQIKLPGGTFKYEDETEELPAIEGELGSWGILTDSLTELLEKLQDAGNVVNPKQLHSLLAQKMPQFGGGDQEDSHELLRHLLDAVRTEDLKRYQGVILDSLNIPRKVAPSTVDAKTRAIVKYYSAQVSDMILRPEQVFRGVLISTLQCQNCQQTSTREETFLDLSLPITPDKPQPPVMRRKPELEDDNKSNKHQTRHQNKQAKKEARKAARKNKSTHNSKPHSDTITEENQLNHSGGESEQSDADVEDNLEDATKILSTPDDKSDCNLSEKIDSPEKSDKSPSYINSVDYPVENIENNTANELTAEADLQELKDHLNTNDKQMHRTSPNVSSNSSECSYLSSPDMPQTTESRNDVSPDEISSSAAAEKPAVIALGWHEPEIKPLSPVKDIFTFYKSPSEDNRFIPSARPDNWSSTVGIRYQCEDNECSIQSCLNQFTAVELMTGNNKVCCEACTKQLGKDGKNVYTNSTKQLLIASPPPVLILHLKRFQVFRHLFRKMCKTVNFPLILDLAPFCSNKCKNLPSINQQQKRLLYSLYGVVEHSGTLHGGHYVAYVKVRPQLQSNDYRWQFLPRNVSSMVERNQADSLEHSTTEALDGDVEDDSNATGVNEPKPPPGKWYYVSDSYVSEANESRVLKSQAYLLFYERIL